jgi:tetratricopeptide (TPR) repeat protein
MERYWAGHPLQGVDSGHNAVTLFERSAPGYRLGLAHFTLGLNALLSGDFTLTLEAAGQVQVIGEAIRDVQLQTYAAWMTGWCEATRGQAETGITACERALTLAPDPLNMAFATGWLGYAMLEHGKPGAVPQLTRAAALMGQMQYWRHQSLFTTFLGEAYRMQGDLDRARDAALQGLTLARETQYHFGIAWSQRVLGQLAQARGTLTEAARALDEACAMFTAMPARFEVGRSHLALADLAHRQGDLAAASQHLREAQHLFTALHVPHYVQITAQRAHVLGL